MLRGEQRVYILDEEPPTLNISVINISVSDAYKNVNKIKLQLIQTTFEISSNWQANT